MTGEAIITSYTAIPDREQYTCCMNCIIDYESQVYQCTFLQKQLNYINQK